MKRSLLVLLITLFSAAVFAQKNPQWLRYPSISPDGSTIVFTYKGDLYSVSSSGGNATQLTFHDAHDYMPVWSQDGSKLAFASDRYGNFDIYIMNAEGGEATRLTYHSNDEKPFTFDTNDSSVLFGAVRQDLASHRQYPTGSQPELYSVSVDGGQVDQVLTVPAEHVQLSTDGNIMLYHDKKGGENEWRKHHTSAITRDIWKYEPASGEHVMITSFKGEDRQPVFSMDEKAMYFLSERAGTFNVFKKNLTREEPAEQLTNFELHPVRFLSMGNGTLAFGYDGEIYTMKEGEEPFKVPVTVRTQAKSNEDRFISINGGVEEMAVSPDGKEIAFIARGEVFVTSVDGALTKRITNTPETEAHVTFTPDGDNVVYASERDGKWSVYQSEIVRKEEEPFFFASSLLKETALIENEEDNYLPRFSPDGSKMAYVAGRRTIRVKDLASGDTIDLMTPDELFHMSDGDKNFRWSPDSKWLLVDWSKLLNNSEVLLLSADGKSRYNLTESGYYDYAPKWMNNGRQMIWFSNQDGLKSYATSGSFQSDVYTMFFDQEEWDKFNMSEEDFKLMQEIEKVNKAASADDDESDKEKEEGNDVKDLNIDFDRMKDWTKKLTIHSSNMSDATLSKDGDKLYYLTRFEDNYNLWETDLRTHETKMAIKLNTGGGSLTWDKDMENLYLLSRGRISKLDLSGGSSKGIQIAGEMDLDAEEERQKMFDHIYIRTKNVFYEPTFHGNDWDMLYKEYQKYVPYVGNGYEFAEMTSEFLGELNVSHAGARYSRSIENADATASLGIFMDYDHEGNGIKIAEVLKGGPLDKADLEIKAEMIIRSIDGEEITQDRDLASYLNRKAGTFTLLEITDKNGGNGRQVRIKPITLGQERNLLYQRFVEINAEEVKERSNGKLGYVHIPGMGDGPFRDIYKDMLGKYYDTEAIIVDTRFNGGGDLVADLVMFFSGEDFITYATARKIVGGEPTSRWTKPTLTMFNEANYSDGHCYAQGYKDMELGLTVGMPVPGTCSFAGWEGLPNGGYWGVVPVSAKNKAGEWMENNQTEPDIRVKNQPEIISKGRDQQLERAIQELLNQVNE